MNFQHTKTPNILFDSLLPTLTESELKILLVIIRQTYGWIDMKTGNRKIRDRISHSQFVYKSGLSRRIISNALKSLVEKGLIEITCQGGNILKSTEDRKGKTKLIYSTNLCKIIPEPTHLPAQFSAKFAYNKRNYTKENKTKVSDLPIRQDTTGTIKKIIEQSKYQSLLRF